MAVVLDVVLVVTGLPDRLTRLVHPVVQVEIARIPIALHRHRLRPPHRPDAELGVAEPLGAPVLLERLVVRLEPTFGERLEVGSGGRFRTSRKKCEQANDGKSENGCAVLHVLRLWRAFPSRPCPFHRKLCLFHRRAGGRLPLTWTLTRPWMSPMSFSSARRHNTGAYTTPFSNTGIEFFPLGVLPGHSGVVLHESGFVRSNRDWNFPDMFSPFWRLIYDFRLGHKIVFPEREVALGPERIVLLPDHHRCHFQETRPTPTFWLHFSHPRRPVPLQPIPIELVLTRIEMDLIGELVTLFGGHRRDENRERIFRLSIALLQVVLSRPDIQWMKEKPESLLKAVHFIEQHFAEPIYNPQLARLANMSTTSFVEEFRRCQGVTPARFISQIRIREVCNLLANTAMSLDDVAERTGFPNRAYLSRVFKRVTGESPAHFRRDHTVSAAPG